MGESRAALTETDSAFIKDQPMFFVATAAADGRINMSAKGLDSFRVLGPNRVAWLNLTGSGNETAAHVLEYPRMTLMFCAIGEEPKTIRLYGTARILHQGDPDWAEFAARFPSFTGTRQIFDVDVDLVHQSCGWGVPVMEVIRPRAEEKLVPHFDRKGPDGTLKYQQIKNRVSLDGKPTDIT